MGDPISSLVLLRIYLSRYGISTVIEGGSITSVPRSFLLDQVWAPGLRSMRSQNQDLEAVDMPHGLPPPYPVIYQRLMKGEIIPFLGAGVPLYSRNPKVIPWSQGSTIQYLPTAGELAADLQQSAGLPESERGELTKMAQYYEAAIGRGPLQDRLREIFSHGQPPTPLHEFLASVDQPLLIVTTNYDDLMERALLADKRPYDVVVHCTEQATVQHWPHGQTEPIQQESRNLLIDLKETWVVYKIHGAIDRRHDQAGQYVITEDDYVEFLTRMTRGTVIPTIFADPFNSRPFLFLGYGLYDWNLRVILNLIQAFRGKPKYRSWAIETLTKPVEERLWTLRGVDVYDGLTLENFLDELKKQATGGAAAGPTGAAGGKTP